MSAKFRKAIEDRIKMLQANKQKVAKVGIVGYQHYDDKNQTPVAYIAAIHEYGAPSRNIPPRPFFRPTFSAQKKNWVKTGAELLRNGASVEDMLDLVSARAAGDVKETLSNILSPPLAVSTKIARNRKAHQRSAKYGKTPNAVSIKPLVDTGLLFDSIDHVVVEKE